MSVVIYDKPQPKRRCKHRDRHISWCRKKAKFCNSPSEYETCPDYEPGK